MNLLWCHGWASVRGDGLDARSGCGNWARFSGAEAVVPLEVLDQIFNVLVENLWRFGNNGDWRWFFDISGHARWMPDSETLCVDHGGMEGGEEERDSGGKGG